MDQIAMRWAEGKSKGATSVVKRSAIKSAAIAVRKKVSVVRVAVHQYTVVSWY